MAEKTIGRVLSIEVIVGNGVDIVPALNVQIDQQKFEGDQLKERKTVNKKLYSIFFRFAISAGFVWIVSSGFFFCTRAKLSKLKPSSSAPAFARAIVNELHLDEQDKPQFEAAITSLKQQLVTNAPPAAPTPPIVASSPPPPVAATASPSPAASFTVPPRAPSGLALLSCFLPALFLLRLFQWIFSLSLLFSFRFSNCFVCFLSPAYVVLSS